MIFSNNTTPNWEKIQAVAILLIKNKKVQYTDTFKYEKFYYILKFCRIFAVYNEFFQRFSVFDLLYNEDNTFLHGSFKK